MASTQGKIQLALRNTVDTDVVPPPPVLQTSLFASDAPAPVLVAKHSSAPKVERAPAPAPYVVEVITGSKRETKSFTNP